MVIQFDTGVILFDSGDIAFDPACCCSCCPGGTRPANLELNLIGPGACSPPKSRDYRLGNPYTVAAIGGVPPGPAGHWPSFGWEYWTWTDSSYWAVGGLHCPSRTWGAWLGNCTAGCFRTDSAFYLEWSASGIQPVPLDCFGVNEVLPSSSCGLDFDITLEAVIP